MDAEALHGVRGSLSRVKPGEGRGLRGYIEEVFQERAGELEERLGYLDRERLSLLETRSRLSEELKGCGARRPLF